MAHNETGDNERMMEHHPAKAGLPIDPMGNAEWRMAGLRHAMGVCIISIGLMFQLGTMALDFGYDLLGYELASMASMAIFALMAGWRSYDLSSGKRSDMGVLFLAYQEGREVLTRVFVRILSILAIAESVTHGVMAFAVFALIVSIAVSEADKFIVMATYRGYRDQTRDGDDMHESGVAN